jgi:hypothetical protein
MNRAKGDRSNRAVPPGMKPPGLIAMVLVLFALLAAEQLRAGSWAATEPAASASQLGPAQAVFATRTHSCERIDIPNANPRAFRDYRDEVHLIATHFVARACADRARTG